MWPTVSVARTRLSPPRLKWEAVDRPRLLKRLTEAESVTFVIGPAGSGKTTLLSQAYAEESYAAWLSLGVGDNDPTQLWSALAEAMGRIVPEFGSTLQQQLLTQKPRIIDGIVPAAINVLSGYGHPLTLFIDDLHLVTRSESLSSIELFIDQRPHNVSVVVASREAAPFPLERHHFDGDLITIGPAELAMTADEAIEMLDAAGLQVDVTQGERLHAQLEGWVAGLRWATMALRDEPDLDRLLTTATSPDSDIGRYIVEEVLDRQPAEHRQFLLETSILHGLHRGLCDAIRGSDDSGLMLEQLERTNALVTRTDDSDGWYHYHHLARELLAARLQRESPASVAELHRRAAAWCSNHGEVRSAVLHALEAGERILAADTLCGSWWDLVNIGQIQTVGSLLECFEASEIHGYPPLAAAASLHAAIDGDLARANQFYTSARSGEVEGAPPDGAASFESTLAILRGALVFEGVEQALRDGQIACSLEPFGSKWRPLAALIVGLGLTWRGDPAGAAPYLTEVATAEGSDTAIVVYAMAELAIGLLLHGRAVEARAMADEACTLAYDGGVDTLFPTTTAHAASALCCLALGEQHVALRHLEAAEDPSRVLEQGLPVDSMRVSLLLANASLELGRLAAAEAHVTRAAGCEALIADTGVLGEQLVATRWCLEQATTQIDSDYDLSDRELEVLGLLSTSLTVRQIGSQLYLSKNTVKTYQRSLYRKLGVHTRADAVAEARRAGVLSEGLDQA